MQTVAGSEQVSQPRWDLIDEAIDSLRRAESGEVPLEYVERVAALAGENQIRPGMVLPLAQVNYASECRRSALTALELVKAAAR